jgi:hypothetical protein
MGFYMFDQNNSGGFFDVDDLVCHRVVIEAETQEDAENIFAPMVVNQSSSCPCCGDRWHGCDLLDINRINKNGYEVSVHGRGNDSETEKEWFDKYGEYGTHTKPSWIEKFPRRFEGRIIFKDILEYLQFSANEYGWTTPDIRVYFLNGEKLEIFK